jgi:hypothetical protein
MTVGCDCVPWKTARDRERQAEQKRMKGTDSSGKEMGVGECGSYLKENCFVL